MHYCKLCFQLVYRLPAVFMTYKHPRGSTCQWATHTLTNAEITEAMEF